MQPGRLLCHAWASHLEEEGSVSRYRGRETRVEEGKEVQRGRTEWSIALTNISSTLAPTQREPGLGAAAAFLPLMVSGKLRSFLAPCDISHYFKVYSWIVRNRRLLVK